MSKRILIFTIVFFSLLVIAPTHALTKKKPKQDFPKKVNYFLSWSITESEARELAKWDMLVLDMELQERHPKLLKKIREWNPDIIMLVYITPQEIRQDAAVSYSRMRAKLFSGIKDSWFLKNSLGKKLSWWPETYLLNVTQSAPYYSGKRLNDYMVDFVVDELLSTEHWDGVFYDNAWDNITYFAKTKSIDLNGSRSTDNSLDISWREGMKYIYNKTRDRAKRDIIIVGNGTSLAYTKELDGQMFENFHNVDWSELMTWYKESNKTGNFSIINANTDNKGGESKASSRRMRYGFTSALLEDGYYSYDFGDKSHGQLWWYDEYGVDLGVSQSTSISDSKKSSYGPDLWRRDFQNGTVIVNSTNKTRTVDLVGEFEKIHGTQDPIVNDGAIVSETDVSSNDGILLLKTFDTLENVVYKNGDFVRFLRADGSRVRNGFFVSDNNYKGGNTIIKTDLTGNGKKDFVVAEGNRLSVWRYDGQLYLKTYPYTVQYKSDLKFAVGDVDLDGKSEIFVYPKAGQNKPIKIYSYDGVLKESPWYPFGSHYNGGYSLAITKGNSPNIIVGAGTTKRPEVYVFNSSLEYVRSWFAYESSFRGGVRVATGDVNGDGKDEIITGPGPGKAPIIKVFSPFGALLYKQFTAYTSLISSGVELQTSDVDFDGIDDILIFSSAL